MLILFGYRRCWKFGRSPAKTRPRDTRFPSRKASSLDLFGPNRTRLGFFFSGPLKPIQALSPQCLRTVLRSTGFSPILTHVSFNAILPRCLGCRPVINEFNYSGHQRNMNVVHCILFNLIFQRVVKSKQPQTNVTLKTFFMLKRSRNYFAIITPLCIILFWCSRYVFVFKQRH